MVNLKRALRRRRRIQTLLPRLRVDDPTLDEVRLVRDGVTDADVMRLADALATNTSVRLLDLSGNKITSRGARALATALLSNKSVEAIRLNGNPLGDAGVGSLCQALRLSESGVRSLYLRRVGVGRYGAQALSAALVGAELRPSPDMTTVSASLTSAFSPTDTSTASLLFDGVMHSERRVPDESGTDLTSPMESLTGSSAAAARDLDNYEDGASSVASVTSSVLLGGMSLSSSASTGERADACRVAGGVGLAADPSASAVVDIDARRRGIYKCSAGDRNDIDDHDGDGVDGDVDDDNDEKKSQGGKRSGVRKGKGKFLSSGGGIVHLDLADNPAIGNRGAVAIASALRSRSCRLRRLNLAGAGVRDSGAVALGTALSENKTLRHLDLYGNSVGDIGAEQVAEALWFNRTIKTVNLGWNRMGNAGKSALATALEGGNNNVVVHLFVSTTSTFSDPRGVVDLSYEEVRAEVKRVEMNEEEMKIRRVGGASRGTAKSARAKPKAQVVSTSKLAGKKGPATVIIKENQSTSTVKDEVMSPTFAESTEATEDSSKVLLLPNETALSTRANEKKATSRHMGSTKKRNKTKGYIDGHLLSQTKPYGLDRHPLDSEDEEEENDSLDRNDSVSRLRYDLAGDENDENNSCLLNSPQHGRTTTASARIVYGNLMDAAEKEIIITPNKPKPMPRSILRSPPLRSPPPPSMPNKAMASSLSINMLESQSTLKGHTAANGATLDTASCRTVRKRPPRRKVRNSYVSDSSSSSSDDDGDDQSAGTGTGSYVSSGGTTNTSSEGGVGVGGSFEHDLFGHAQHYSGVRLPPVENQRESVGMSGSLLEDTTSESENGDGYEDNGDRNFFTDDDNDLDDDVWGDVGLEGEGIEGDDVGFSDSWDAAVAAENGTVWDASDFVAGESDYSSCDEGRLPDGCSKSSKNVRSQLAEEFLNRINVSDILDDSVLSTIRGTIDTPRKSNVTNPVVRMLMDEEEEDSKSDSGHDNRGNKSGDDIELPPIKEPALRKDESTTGAGVSVGVVLEKSMRPTEDAAVLEKKQRQWKFGESVRTRSTSRPFSRPTSSTTPRSHISGSKGACANDGTGLNGRLSSNLHTMVGVGVSKPLFDVRPVNRRLDKDIGPTWDSTKWGKGITPLVNDANSFASPEFVPTQYFSPAWDGEEKCGRRRSTSPWGSVQRDWEQGDDAEVDQIQGKAEQSNADDLTIEHGKKNDEDEVSTITTASSREMSSTVPSKVDLDTPSRPRSAIKLHIPPLSVSKSVSTDDDMASAALRWLESDCGDDESMPSKNKVIGNEDTRNKRDDSGTPVMKGKLASSSSCPGDNDLGKLYQQGTSASYGSCSDEDESFDNEVDADNGIEYERMLGATPRKTTDDQRSVDEAVNALIGTMAKFGPKFGSSVIILTPGGGRKQPSAGVNKNNYDDELVGEIKDTDDGTLVLPWEPSAERLTGKARVWEGSASQSLSLSATMSADVSTYEDSASPTVFSNGAGVLTPKTVNEGVTGELELPDYGYGGNISSGLRYSRSWDQ